MEPTIIRIEIQSPLLDMPFNEGNAELELNTNLLLMEDVVIPETLASYVDVMV